MTDTTELEAQLNEGLAPMPAEMIALREESNVLKEQIDALTARRNEIKEIFGKHLEDEGLQGFLLNGKVHARVTYGTRTTVDSKELKEKMPHIWKKFLKTTKYTSITVN